MQQAQQEMASGGLRKVVLARETGLTHAGEVDAVALFVALAKAEPRTFRFLLPLGERGVYVGASPERILRCRDGRCDTEALAGTRPRSMTAEADLAQRDELTRSFEQDKRNVRRLLDGGVRLGFGTATVTALLAETKLSNQGLGYMIMQIYARFDMPSLYGLLIIVFVIAGVGNLVLGKVTGTG